MINYKDTDGNVIQAPVTDENNVPVGTKFDTTDNKPNRITYNGKEYELVRVEGSENGTVVEGTTSVTYVYQEVKVNVIITYVATDGTVLKTAILDTTGKNPGTPYNTKENDDEYPLYIVKGEAIYRRVLAGNFAIGDTTEDGHLVSSASVSGVVEEGTKVVTYVYELVTIPTDKKVVTNHVDEDGNVVAPKEDGIKPNTSISGYEYTGKTTTDKDGNVTHVYRKVPTTPTTPETPEPGRPGTPVPSAPAKPGQPATPKAGKAQLPNTGESSSVIGAFGTAMLVAALALVGKRRRKED